ncbi:MAG TPA: hypothetical protein VMI54_00740 [Polyangiaceae bacterium]|nr:hypothetical protein [Polyangiaceae bacterium]
MVAWRRPGALTLLGAAIATATVLSEQYTRFLRGNVSDDAVTSMQYAKNLVLGNGLVFNVGERVDGYTNFLWVLFMAPLYAFSRLTGLDFVATLVEVTIGIQAVVLALLFVVGARLWQARLGVFVALFLCVVDSSFVTWADLGLEVHFLAFWLLLALALWRSLLPERALFTGLALAGAILTRPDAALFGMAVIGSELVEAALAWLRGATREAKESGREALVIAAAWLVPYAIYFAWHYAYYGEPFPNTYYTKLGGPIDAWSRGLDYLQQFLDVRGWVPALGVFALFGVRDKTIRAVVAYLAVHTLYVVYVGGDFMPGHRFFVPQLPLYYLLVGASVELLRRFVERPRVRALLEPRGVSPAFVTGFIVAIFAGGLVFLADRERKLGPLDAVRASWGEDHGRQRRLMTWLRDRKPKNATFATGLIGHVGFFGDIYVIDTCGIIDKETAHKNVRHFGHGLPGHEKQASPEAVLARKPTYVGIRVLPGDLWQRGYYLDIDLPPATVDGLWTRDDLPERGHFLENTRVDFEHGAPPGWTASGTAFASWPTRGHGAGQGDIGGAEGMFVNSYDAKLGNGATGTLRSAPFRLEGDLFVFRMAGGNDPERLRASLIVDGKRVFSSTANDNDTMGRRAWNIAPYRGKTAVFELVDEATGGWGYVAVDDLVQWVAGPA